MDGLHMEIRRTITRIALIVGLALFATACGGDAAANTAATGETGEPVESIESDGGTDSGEGDGAATEAEDGTADNENDLDDDVVPEVFEGDSDSDFCNDVRAANDSDRFAGLIPIEPRYFIAVASLFEEIELNAPTELEQNFVNVRSALSEVIELQAADDFDPFDSEQRDPLDDVEVRASASRINNYATGVCGEGIDL